MSTYLKISDGLYMTKSEFVNEAHNPQMVNTPRQNVHHIFIVDCSGSMHSIMRDMVDDIKRMVKTIPSGDHITIGRFSSEGDFSFFITGYRILDDDDFASVYSLIDKHLHATYLTCFSQILEETRSVIENVNAFCPNHSLMFFSDGCPVVRDYQKEVASIDSSTRKLGAVISSAMVIGYGNWYDRDILTNIATNLGTTMVHASNVDKYSMEVQAFVDEEKRSSKTMFSLDVEPDYPSFVVDADSGLSVYQGKDIYVSVPESAKTVSVYSMVTDETKIPGGWKKVTKAKMDDHLPALYAASLLLSQRARTDVAMEVLSMVGDIDVVNRLNNSFTNEDYGLVEDDIRNSITNPDSRFVGGRKKNCLPDPNAYCLMDLFEDLSNGSNTFHPRSSIFKYKRIGAKSLLKEGIEYPEFIPEEDQGYEFGDNFTWNRNRANLSVRIKENGRLDFSGVTIDESLSEKLPKKLSSFRYRNFAIVADGDYRVPILPVKLDKATFDKLKTTPLLHGNVKYTPGRVYGLAISKIPVINRNMAKQEYISTDFFDLVNQELRQKAGLKVYKYYLNQMKTETDNLSQGLISVFGEDGAKFLKEKGITDNGFSPLTMKADAMDYYMANYFSVKVKGVSSLPKVEDVESKMTAGKPLTLSQSLLCEHVEKVNEKKKAGGATLKTWLSNQIDELKLEKFKTASKIQRIIFTMVIGNVWFADLETREPEPIEHNDFTYTVRLEQKKINI